MVAGTNRKELAQSFPQPMLIAKIHMLYANVISAGPQLKSSCLVGAVVLTMPGLITRTANNQSWQLGGLEGWGADRRTAGRMLIQSGG